MATRETFTDEEWQDLQWALMLAGSHVTASDWPGWRKSFKEAAGGSRFLTLMQSSDNALVAALTSDQARRRPPDVSDRSTLAGEPALARIRAATALVREKAPEDLEDFRQVLLGVAQVMADEVDGTSEAEGLALERIREALA
ncbi:hypothetical protein [Nocardioides taihuensis]|uniref:DUF222 domain-containing protein n=1 Tax=Nocardioides taihuensis TaxID=1835606 RepID=A0ABW0BN83_9ACTN